MWEEWWTFSSQPPAISVVPCVCVRTAGVAFAERAFSKYTTSNVFRLWVRCIVFPGYCFACSHWYADVRHHYVCELSKCSWTYDSRIVCALTGRISLVRSNRVCCVWRSAKRNKQINRIAGTIVHAGLSQGFCFPKTISTQRRATVLHVGIVCISQPWTWLPTRPYCCGKILAWNERVSINKDELRTRSKQN